MRRMLLAFALIGPELAQANVYGSSLSSFSAISVLVLDNDMSGSGCWKNYDEVELYAKNRLKIAGVNVVDWTPFSADPEAVLWITNSGRRTNNGLCEGAFDISLKTWATSIEGHRGFMSFSSVFKTYGNYQNVDGIAFDLLKIAIDELLNSN